MSSTRKRLQKMSEQKVHIEEEIKAYGEVLESQGNVGMQGSLVDKELYPRNDIDVYAVRKARQKIICLQNDHKALMRDIDYLLEQLHKDKPETQRIETDVNRIRLREEDVIAIVGVVEHGSPAHIAGFEQGDKILKFGSLDCKNFKSLQDIGKIVQSSQGQTTTVEVQRASHVVTLNVVPSPWSGGLLGCKVLPVKK